MSQLKEMDEDNLINQYLFCFGNKPSETEFEHYSKNPDGYLKAMQQAIRDKMKECAVTSCEEFCLLVLGYDVTDENEHLISEEQKLRWQQTISDFLSVMFKIKNDHNSATEKLASENVRKINNELLVYAERSQVDEPTSIT